MCRYHGLHGCTTTYGQVYVHHSQVAPGGVYKQMMSASLFLQLTLPASEGHNKHVLLHLLKLSPFSFFDGLLTKSVYEVQSIQRFKNEFCFLNDAFDGYLKLKFAICL